MERTQINELNTKIGELVLIKGWLHEVRDQSKIKFIILRDRSGAVQLVINQQNKQLFDEIASLTRESVLSVTGIVKPANITNPEVSEKEIEVLVEKLEVLSAADKNLPIQVVQGKESAELPTRLDYRWLDLRKPKNTLIFKIWTHMEAAMREYWLSHGFMQIHSPKLIGVPSEGGAEVFAMNYFGKQAYLAQSPQFYKQMAMAAGFERIFEIGPVFRSNPSHTVKHDTEYTSVDIEISYIDSEEDVMKCEEEWLVHVITRMNEKYGSEIKKEFGRELIVPTTPFPRVKYSKALEKLNRKELDSEGERQLGELIKEEQRHEFVFVTEYPIEERPFYHMRKEGQPHLTKSFDLLWNGLEITTGAQREHRYDQLRRQAIEKNMNLEALEDYLNFFKYGCPPHGGFGLSPTRMLMIALNIKNVREVTFLPRDPDRLRP